MALKTDREKTAHLLRRFGLGASEAELDFYLEGRGLKGAIDKLLNYEAVTDLDIDLDRFANDKGLVNMKGVQVWWYASILTTKRPFEAAMCLFWHNHFATSAEKVDAVGAMHDHVQTIRKYCSGKFQDLLTNISKDPAMLYWLDNHENKTGKPNENFAREVMELFTLGIGNYSEKDVQEAARALTGWTYGVQRGQRVIETPKPAQRPKLKVDSAQPRIEFLFREEQHDTGEKNFLSNRGNFDGDDVLGILCGNPRTAIFLTHKAWNWFVYPNPEPAVVERVAKAFRDSGLDIKVLVRTIIESPEFFSEKAERAVIKNPVAFCVSTLRELGLGSTLESRLTSDPELKGLRAAGPVAIAMLATKSMGMELLFPPDVSGWKFGEAWISSATMVERMKWAERLFGSSAVGAPNGKVPAGAQSVRYPVFGLFASDPSPKNAVDRLVSVFDAQLPGSKIDQLVKNAEDASKGAIDARNANEVAASVTRLIFGSPEFQFC